MKFTVIVEKGKTNYGAYAPDVPGCGAVGRTAEEAERNIVEALEFHFEGMVEHGDLPLPKSTSYATEVNVRVPQPHRKASLTR